MTGMQARSMVGQIAPPLSRGSPSNHMLFAHPATSGLHTSANPSTVFLLTSSAPDPATFSQGGVHSPTFLTQFPSQVLHNLSTHPALIAESVFGSIRNYPRPCLPEV